MFFCMEPIWKGGPRDNNPICLDIETYSTINWSKIWKLSRCFIIQENLCGCHAWSP